MLFLYIKVSWCEIIKKGKPGVVKLLPWWSSGKRQTRYGIIVNGFTLHLQKSESTIQACDILVTQQ